MAAATEKDFLGMSDEDFLNINSPDDSPVVAAKEEEGQGETPASTDSEDTAQVDENKEEIPTSTDDEVEGEVPDDKAEDDKGDAVTEVDEGLVEGAEPEDKWTEFKPDTTKTDTENAEAKVEHDKTKPAEEPVTPKSVAEGVVTETPIDHEAFYKQIMTPFKANGRRIELKTPEEAVRLMQMGAGYGRKIQELQPHLKVLRMLEKNELLDEDRLSLLIEVNQKNPEAIRKIIADSGIDPLDLNMEDNVSYRPKSHSVSDKEMAFQEVLSDVQGHDTGQETLQLINQTWDQESKSALWDQPQILSVIQTQRDNGLYDQIAAEVDRQKLLGHISNNTPFLQAYKTAGDHLQETGGFKILEGQEAQIQNQSRDTSQPQVIATRSAAPKAQVQNGAKAAAAASTKTSGSRKTGATVNPLEMADDVFMKQFENRL